MVVEKKRLKRKFMESIMDYAWLTVNADYYNFFSSLDL